MPPKRGARGGGRAASRTPGPQESPSTRLSTSYGSPAAPNAGPRALNAGGASSALNRVLEDVDSVNASNPDMAARAVRAHMLQARLNPNPGFAQGGPKMPAAVGAAGFPGAGAATATGVAGPTGLGGPSPRSARTARVQFADDVERSSREPRPPRQGDSEDDLSDSDGPDAIDDKSKMPPPPPPGSKRSTNKNNNRKFARFPDRKSQKAQVTVRSTSSVQ